MVVEHLFMCVSAICASSSVKCLFLSFAYFLVGLFRVLFFTVDFLEFSVYSKSQSCYQKWGLVACHLEVNEEARLVERKVQFISEVGSGVEGGGTCVQRPTPPTNNQWARGRGRWQHAETAQSARTVILKSVIRWSDQHHLDYLGYSQSSVSRIGLFPFFEANSQNCGSFFHGSALVVIQITSPTWWGFEANGAAKSQK